MNILVERLFLESLNQLKMHLKDPVLPTLATIGGHFLDDEKSES